MTFKSNLFIGIPTVLFLVTAGIVLFDPFKKEIRPQPVKNAVLVLDIDGDGIRTGPGDGNIYFDFGRDGFKEKTSWTDKDAFLVRFPLTDEENDYFLFGDKTVLSDGKEAGNGLLALMDLDTDQNGVLNEKDAAFDEINLWQNSNGDTLLGLKTLREAGIKSIRFEWDGQEKKDLYGSTFYRAGTVKTDKETRGLFLVRFKADYMNTRDTTETDIPADIAALPKIKGTGNVHDLHIALALAQKNEDDPCFTGIPETPEGTDIPDTDLSRKPETAEEKENDRCLSAVHTKASYAWARTLLALYTKEKNPVKREELLTNFLYAWAGVFYVDPASRASTPAGGDNAIGDARKLETLEAFWGDGYLGIGPDGNKDPNPHFAAAPILLETFEVLRRNFDDILLTQTHYRPLLNAMRYKWNDKEKRLDVTIEKLLPLLKKEFPQQKENGRLYLNRFADVLRTLPESRVARWNPLFWNDGEAFIAALRNVGNIHGTDFESALATIGKSTIGTDAADDLAGTDGNDVIYGLDADDTLSGNDGNDTLNGGSGNDMLIGGNGTDLYVFSQGFGQDIIDNAHTDEATDEILFGTGLSSRNAVVSREEKDMIIRFGETDNVRITDYFDEKGLPSGGIGKIVFSDEPGTVWTTKTILSKLIDPPKK